MRPTPGAVAVAGPPPTEQLDEPEEVDEATAAGADHPAEQERRFFAAPSGLLGDDAGGLAIALGIGTALGLAGIVLGVWNLAGSPGVALGRRHSLATLGRLTATATAAGADSDSGGSGREARGRGR